MSTAGDRSTLDDVQIHQILSNERRQHALRALWEAGEGLPVRELSEQVAEAETGESPPPSNIRQSVYVSLHQSHLPKLDELDIVEYDPTGHAVTLTERAEQVRIYTEVVPQRALSWSEYYIGISLLGLLLVIAGETGVPMVADVGGFPLASFTFGLILVSAVYQRATQRSLRLF